MQDDSTNEPISYHDDNRVLRYLLHTVKGLSPVSGGVLGEALENEYESAEAETRAVENLDFEGDI
ncbi:MAG: hypothetical protein JWN75_928 [Candidatus Saccharibacteria bacterium]|nr:hypothetical protein [Candidatus Saccharibacteria bacterium]